MNKSGMLGIIIALSIAMVGATVAIAIPSPVEAAPKFSWCYITASLKCRDAGGEAFNGKGECKKAEAEEPTPVFVSCHKVPVS